MDVIYHRNCLDGVFSAHMAYLISKVIQEADLNNFVDELLRRVQKKKENLENTEQFQRLTDLTEQVLDYQSTQMIDQNQLKPKQTVINEQFFHGVNHGVSYSAYSFFAGEFFPLKFSTKSRILFVLDTHLSSYENFIPISEKYDVVVLIDHHTSFKSVKKDILLYKEKFSKLFWVFSQQHCATQLSYHFFNRFFKFDQWFEPKHVHDLKTMIGYVSANDRKHKETKESKSFILGFYYFEIELSHLNPLLNKRLGMINLEYLMEKGTSNFFIDLDLYKQHIQQITDSISRAQICTLEMSGKLKGSKFYIIQPSNPSKISDTGVVLSFLSKKSGMQNLALLYMPKQGQVRISARSNRSMEDPLALQLAQKFQGGGHVCAAGFKIPTKRFKSLFIRSPGDKQKLKINQQQVQKILFNSEYL